MTSELNFPVMRALADCVLPAARRWGMEKIFVASLRWRRGLELPADMSLTRQTLRGTRVPVRERRAYGASVVES